MPLGSEKVVNVIGHINPDKDSICSAIAYARLKREVTGENFVAKRAGQINAETRFVKLWITCVKNISCYVV